MKKKSFIVLVAALLFVGIISVDAQTYDLGEIKNLSYNVTRTSDTAQTISGKATLKAERTSSSNTASWRADLYSRSGVFLQNDELIATGNMNLSSLMTEYSIKWNTTFSAGYKLMKATGISGTVTFDASLIMS